MRVRTGDSPQLTPRAPISRRTLADAAERLEEITGREVDPEEGALARAARELAEYLGKVIGGTCRIVREGHAAEALAAAQATLRQAQENLRVEVGVVSPRIDAGASAERQRFSFAAIGQPMLPTPTKPTLCLALALSLPRGVGNSVSSLSYYVVLFLGLLAALELVTKAVIRASRAPLKNRTGDIRVNSQRISGSTTRP